MDGGTLCPALNGPKSRPQSKGDPYSYRMCLATNQADKLLPDILDDCLNSPPPNKPRLLKKAQAIPDKGHADTLSHCSS